MDSFCFNQQDDACNKKAAMKKMGKHKNGWDPNWAVPAVFY